MNDPDPELAQARREEAERWLAIVGDDIDMARAAMHLSPPRPGPAAFHLQQAAEKTCQVPGGRTRAENP